MAFLVRLLGGIFFLSLSFWLCVFVLQFCLEEIYLFFYYYVLSSILKKILHVFYMSLNPFQFYFPQDFIHLDFLPVVYLFHSYFTVDETTVNGVYLESKLCCSKFLFDRKHAQSKIK